jgi:hypothetical protein
MEPSKYPKLPKAFKKKWVAALRSGKYKQGFYHLKHLNDGEHRYCCLGVAATICGATNLEGAGGIIRRGYGIKGINKVPKELIDRGSEDNPLTSQLILMNDSGSRSFKKIATWIEKNL